jgi:hypothetical protein
MTTGYLANRKELCVSMVWPYSILLTCTCIHIHTYIHTHTQIEGLDRRLACVYTYVMFATVLKIQQVDYSYIAGERFLLTPGKCLFGYSFDIPSFFTLKEKEKSLVVTPTGKFKKDKKNRFE